MCSFGDFHCVINRLPLDAFWGVIFLLATPPEGSRVGRGDTWTWTNANEVVGDIHDRMPLILPPAAYSRWLSVEPDPGELMRPFPAELMRMWPISTRVNKPENDDPSIAGGAGRRCCLDRWANRREGLGRQLGFCDKELSGGNPRFGWLAQDIAAAPDRLDVVLAV